MTENNVNTNKSDLTDLLNDIRENIHKNPKRVLEDIRKEIEKLPLGERREAYVEFRKLIRALSPSYAQTMWETTTGKVVVVTGGLISMGAVGLLIYKLLKRGGGDAPL